MSNFRVGKRAGEGNEAGSGMGRKLRIEFPGAIYHVINRGYQRSDKTGCEADRNSQHDSRDMASAWRSVGVHEDRGMCARKRT